MSSNITLEHNDLLLHEKDELLQSQERILLSMERNNDIRHEELEQRRQELLLREKELEHARTHDEILRNRTVADLQQVEIDKERNIQLAEKNRLENEKLKLIEQQVTDLKIIIELLREYLMTTVPSQESKFTNFHQKLDRILEFLRIIISHILPDANRAEKDRLSHLLRELAQSGNSISIKPDMTVNAHSIDSLTNTETTYNR